jgi:hypothetical protein
MKKTYEVELKYTSYVIITVEADNEEEAETLAWRELELSGSISRGGDWELESIEEMKGER